MKHNSRNYDIYSGEDLKIADRIQRLRLKLLIHSCLYYELDYNIISDKEWDALAKELVLLQKQYPEISNNVMWYEAFADWDASTGAFLPIRDEWVVRKAKWLLANRQSSEIIEVKTHKREITKSKKVESSSQISLF